MRLFCVCVFFLPLPIFVFDDVVFLIVLIFSSFLCIYAYPLPISSSFLFPLLYFFLLPPLPPFIFFPFSSSQHPVCFSFILFFTFILSFLLFRLSCNIKMHRSCMGKLRSKERSVLHMVASTL